MKLCSKSSLFLLAIAATLALTVSNAGRVRAEDPPANSGVQQRLEAMRERADQLDKDGKHEDAERMRAEIKKYAAKLSAGGSAPDTPDVGRRLEQARQRADQLDSEGKHEEANRIREEIKKYAAKLSAGGGKPEVTGQRHEGKIEISDADREKLQSIRRKVAELEKNGQHEDAEHLKQEAKQLYAKYYQPRGDGASTRTPSVGSSASPGEIAGKLDHLRVAIDHLRAAGFEGEANHIHEIAEKLERYSHGDSQPAKSSSTKSPSTPARTVAFGEQNLRELGSKDGHVLTKADFLASAKSRGKDVSKAESSWNSLTGNKDSITLGEFQQKISTARQKAEQKPSNP